MNDKTGGFYAPNQAVLGHLFGVSTRTIARWSKAGAPARTAAGYDIGAFIRWRLRGDAGSADDLAEARRRRECARAKLDEMKVAREQKKVVSNAEYEQMMDRLCGAFVSVIQRAPVQLCCNLAMKTISECRDILQQWADREQDRAFGPPDHTEAK